MSDELCIFCKNRLEDDLLVKVTQKGLTRIRECSVKRDDELLHELNQDIQELTVHVKCRKSYINESMIKAYRKRKLLLNSAEISSPIFNFELNCFLCGTEAFNSRTPNSVVGGMRRVRMTHTKETIKEAALRRKDVAGETVLQRIQDVDLVAVAARYHISCYDTFRLADVLEGQRKPGRPKSDAACSTMVDIYRSPSKKTDTSLPTSYDYVYHADVEEKDFSNDGLENEEEQNIKFEHENESEEDLKRKISGNTRSNKNEDDSSNSGEDPLMPTTSKGKRKKFSHKEKNKISEDTDELQFFQSILPDIKKFTRKEKRKLKMGILLLIDEIDDERKKKEKSRNADYSSDD